MSQQVIERGWPGRHAIEGEVECLALMETSVGDTLNLLQPELMMAMLV
jgi:hypothetical protein